MSSIPLGISGATGRHPFFHQARVKLFENVDYSQEKGTLWRTCKGPARRLILEKRDKYEKN